MNDQETALEDSLFVELEGLGYIAALGGEGRHDVKGGSALLGAGTLQGISQINRLLVT